MCKRGEDQDVRVWGLVLCYAREQICQEFEVLRGVFGRRKRSMSGTKEEKRAYCLYLAIS